LSLECIEIGGEGATGSIIWMHGLGADGHDFSPIIPWIQRPDLRVVLPHAPVRRVTLNDGMRMRSWFDIRYIGGGSESGERECPNESAESAALIEQIIENEHMRGVPYDRIALVGFSQGGAMSLYTGCRFSHRLAGMACLSGYLLFNEEHLDASSEENRKTPVLICHGTYDPMVPYDGGRLSAEFLDEHGWPTQFNTYQMAHEVLPQEIEDLRLWLEEILPSIAPHDGLV